MSRFVHRLTTTSLPALTALVAVTAVWGLTFVQVKDAVAVYPLFPFLAIRFGIASLTLAVPATRRLRTLGRGGLGAAALAGALVAAGYTLQTLGLERTSVSSAGFITGMYVVLTPLLAFAVFRLRIAGSAWVGVALATLGLALLAGIQGARPAAACSCSRAQPSTRCRSCSWNAMRPGTTPLRSRWPR